MDGADNHRTFGPGPHWEAATQVEKDGKFVITGNLFDGADNTGNITAFGTKSQPSLTNSRPVQLLTMMMVRSMTVNERWQLYLHFANGV